jgi:hypothetical protein
MVRTVRLIILCALLIGFAADASAQYFPATGKEALHQRALDARSRLNVLSIAYQPGQEDLAALAYFRMAKGARIVSAYVTNGEAGESDIRGEYPHLLAGTRRLEAAKVMAFLGGEEYFLNMPDLGAARDTEVVRSGWEPDTLRTHLTKLVTSLKPDVILLARNWNAGGMGPEDAVLQQDLFHVLRQLDPEYEKSRGLGSLGLLGWTVARVLVETGSENGVRVPVEERHPLWKKSYLAVADEAAALYRSCSVQRKLWYGADAQRTVIAYESLFPRSQRPLRRFDEGLPPPIPKRLNTLEASILALTKPLLGGNLPSAGREQAARAVSALLDSVDMLLTQPLSVNHLGRKISMQWKLTLENLRIAVLGIHIRYTLQPTTVVPRQVIHLKIDEVIGTKPGDSLWVYFPATDERWMIDESSEKTRPLRINLQYSLLSPQVLDMHLPAAIDGLVQTSIGRTFTFFVMGRSKYREGNFIYRGSTRLLYAPRLTTEVLTPIVRAVPDEEVIVRITNHVRDGIRDSVHVNDSLAVSGKKEFRINVKDESETDTLHLQWKRPLAEGTHLIPVSIAHGTVAQFAARSFEAAIGTKGTIVLVTGRESSPVAVTLRRLGLKVQEVRSAQGIPPALANKSTVMIDRRALTLLPKLSAEVGALRRFAEEGGHLIVLAQDAPVWNASPIIEGLQLRASNKWGEATKLELRQSEEVFSTPNMIALKDWDEWLYRRAYNVLDGPALATSKKLLVSADEKSPLIVEWTVGSGKMTYIDLALDPQLLNVHPGAFRLLANLTAY